MIVLYALYEYIDGGKVESRICSSQNAMLEIEFGVHSKSKWQPKD